MKRFLLAIFAIIVTTITATAQTSTQSIVIEQSSFKGIEQTDALTNVNIDPIQLDFSKRPCARIKMHINRMTREEIGMLEVMPIGGNIVIMRSETAYEGNGMIIELTAKPNTRFYLHHPVFGDSNEVSVNLEGNREYRLEAYLNQQYPITVATNVADADVYIDNTFVGKTNREYILVAKDVVPGERQLKIEYNGVVHEEVINVHAGNVYFRRELNVETEKFSVHFTIFPANATFVLNGMELPLSGGQFTASLGKGKHSYFVKAKDYIAEHGSITVDGSMDKQIVLTRGIGLLKLASTPQGATVTIDNERIGTTPLLLDNISAGAHTLVISMFGYQPYSRTITIVKNETTELSAVLVPKRQQKDNTKEKVADKPVNAPATTPVKKEAYTAKKGYEQSIEFGYSSHSFANGAVDNLALSYIGGYRANKTLFVGLGVGAGVNMHNFDNTTSLEMGSGASLEPSKVDLPIFVHLRTYFGKKSRLFASLSAGGKFLYGGNLEYEGATYKYNSIEFLGDLGVGVRLGKLYLRASLSAQTHPQIATLSNTQLEFGSKLGLGGKVAVGITF